MTREERLSLADAANTRAATLARDAERAARGDARALAEPLAAALPVTVNTTLED